MKWFYQSMKNENTKNMSEHEKQNWRFNAHEFFLNFKLLLLMYTTYQMFATRWKIYGHDFNNGKQLMPVMMTVDWNSSLTDRLCVGISLFYLYFRKPILLLSYKIILRQNYYNINPLSYFVCICKSRRITYNQYNYNFESSCF